MCGISGAFSLDQHPLPDDARAAVRRMNERIAHRGPDGDGFFDAPTAAFGHRRLAIIDRAGGHQPMANEDESCWIVFNGEIYNHRDLRSVLESKGHRYRTSSDTETILHAYEEYGAACVDLLDGMFAFVIYDGRTRELFAARDRLGKKPFFYAIRHGVLYFASELPALRALPAFSAELDPEAVASYFALGYVLAPKTIFRDVHKLMPGHWLSTTDGRVTTRQYWDVTEFDSDSRPDDELLEDVDNTLRAAVHARLESEVPLGAFLSGGIDSGLVVSYMAEALGDRLVTTTVGFGDPQHNELAAAALVANRFNSRHHAELVEPELDAVIGPVVDGLGEPLADSSAIPTWYVCRSARRHVTVALSGDGGDETFAGYDFRYVPHAAEASIRRLLPAPARLMARQLGARWPTNPGLPRPLRLRTPLENLGSDAADAYYRDLTFLKPEDTRALLGRSSTEPDVVRESVTSVYRRCPSRNAVQCAEYADLKVYMPNGPLVKVDRMSMAHALEVRSPFLDRRVVELAFRIPASRKQVGRQGKVLLRRLAQRRLPAGLWSLPKRGFTVPVGAWIAGPYAEQFRQEVLGSSSSGLTSHVDLGLAGRRLAAHQGGTQDHGYLLWALWSLNRWLADTPSSQKSASR